MTANRIAKSLDSLKGRCGKLWRRRLYGSNGTIPRKHADRALPSRHIDQDIELVGEYTMSLALRLVFGYTRLVQKSFWELLARV
jgi:hypothetical protein